MYFVTNVATQNQEYNTVPSPPPHWTYFVVLINIPYVLFSTGLTNETMELNSKILSDTAVCIRNGYKRFSPTQIVLNGLNLTIKEHTMYVSTRLFDPYWSFYLLSSQKEDKIECTWYLKALCPLNYLGTWRIFLLPLLLVGAQTRPFPQNQFLSY